MFIAHVTFEIVCAGVDIGMQPLEHNTPCVHNPQPKLCPSGQMDFLAELANV